MFTGIIENVGKVSKKTNNKLTIKLSQPMEDLKLGSSISVDGTCLTVTDLEKDKITVDVMPITFERTMLGERGEGDEVNLERAMEYGKRFEGHMVSGHVEGTGTLESMRIVDNAYHLIFSVPTRLSKYIAGTGSISINGISLTVIRAEGIEFEVGIIPHTWDNTNLHNLQIGDKVNIETDIMAKYAEKLNEFDPEESQEGGCCGGGGC